MRERGLRGHASLFCLGILCLFLGLIGASVAAAAEQPPYEFDAQLSLTGGCGTSSVDPIADPGCPEKHPPEIWSCNPKCTSNFTSPRAVAIDSFGDEYVASYGAEEGKQGRIDFFSPKGVFIGEVKDELGPKNVAVDNKGILYVLDKITGNNLEFARYKPTVYEPAKGKIEYGSRELITEEIGSAGGLAVDSNDHVFVDWFSAIKEYNSAAEGNELKATITNVRLHSSTFIALDQQRRRLYASSCPNEKIGECWILVFDADTHELLEEVKGPDGPESEEIFASSKGWISVAVDEESGDFFVSDHVTKTVYQFNEEYELVSTLKQDPKLFEGGEPLQIAVSNATGAFNQHYLFVPSLLNRALAYNPPKEEGPPIVESLTVSGISEEEAEAQARIRPDGAETTYRFEYLSEEEWLQAAETFTGAKVAGEGTIPAATQEAEVKAPLSGLAPGTAYRFRVFAENEFGPVGKKEVGKDEEEGTFTTYADAPITSSCPEAIRSTYSTLLPDCRAYELVTPADTNGRPPDGFSSAGDVFGGVKASPSGNAVSFLTRGGSIPGLGGAGGLNGDLYRTTRTASGWSTELAGPTGAESSSPDPGSTSPDQGYSFWEASGEGSAVIEGGAHYVRYPDGHSALVGRGSLGTDPRARGKLITEGGTHIVFETKPPTSEFQPIQLEENAPPTGTRAVYDRTEDEVTHVVSLLPGDETPKAGEDATFIGASADGKGIAFEIKGTLYLRVGNATTYEIGAGVEFAGVSEGGARIFYLQGGDLLAFDVASEKAIPFTATGDAVPVNVSSDGTRAYFVSTTKITGSGQSPNGASAEAGQQNLYLSEEGKSIHFVGAVTERDVMGESGSSGQVEDGLGLWTEALWDAEFKAAGHLAIDPSRLTPDGSVLLFSSRADLDGYAHEGVPELYRYDSVGNRLHCISCVPTRMPAEGGSTLQSLNSPSEPAPRLRLSDLVPNLRADGKRAIFQSTEALVSRDNDGVQDVYEWEEQGVGSCARAGGCVSLISSGKSATDNYLYGISASGDDVFFTTADVLVGGDNDTVSIYDARVNGGFPPQEIPCPISGDCPKPSSPAPLFPGPESEGIPGPPVPPAKPCPKGKHRVKGRCVKKHHHKKHHRKAGKARKGAGK